MLLHRRPLALLGVGALTALLALAPATAAAAATSPTYVAVGDSYAAGFGLPAPSVATGQPVPGCEQTSLDYPRRVAASLGLTLTDVTCSGAVTDDFTSSQSVDVPPDPEPQLDAVRRAQPDVVTITIGGNDLGFSSIARDCLAASGSGPLLVHPAYASCSAYFASAAGAASDPYQRLDAVAAKVRAAIAATQQAAPDARIAVIAYPAIAPDAANTPAGGCYNANLFPAPITVAGVPLASALPFTDTDIPYLQVLQQRLDTLIGQQASALGVAYADIYPTSLAHSACSPESTRWVEPIVPGGGGTNVLHPSLAGTAAMAAVIGPVVQGLLDARPLPTPTASAAPTTVAAASPTTVAAVPTSTPSTAVPATPPSSPPSSPATVAAAPQARVGLANTGAQALVPVVTSAALLLAAGTTMVLLGRRRR